MLASPEGAAMLTLAANGQLTITGTATGQVTTAAGPFSGCKAPFALKLLPNGLLAIVDKAGTVVWSSTSACIGSNTSSCYSYQLQDDGQLVVLDGAMQPAWSTGDGWSSSTASSQGWLHQLASGGLPRVSCIHAAPTLLASRVVSMSRRYELLLAQPTAPLQLLDSSTQATLWSPAVSSSGAALRRLCIGTSGVLSLLGDGAAALWSSGGAAATPGPYTALVTEDGCLEVLDGSCKVVYTSHSSTGSAQAAPGGANGRQPPPGRQVAGGSGATLVLPRLLPPGSQVAGGSGATLVLPNSFQKAPPQAAKRLFPPPAPKRQVVQKRSPPVRRGPAAAESSRSGSASIKLTKAPLPQSFAKSPPRAITLQKRPAVAGSPAASTSTELKGAPLPRAFNQGAPGQTQARALQKKPPSATAQLQTQLPASHQSCMLQQAAVCGGINLCGQSAPCPRAGCCANGLSCARASRYTWRCMP
jgi:hypothetical protein